MSANPKHRRYRTLIGLALLLTLLPTAAHASDPHGGQPFPIAASANDEDWPAVAHDTRRNRFLVVFENGVAGMNAVCMNAEGRTVTTYVVPQSGGSNPDVVYNYGLDEYLIVWSQSGTIRGARVAGMCWPGPGGIGASFAISGDRPGTELYPAVAYNSHASHQDYLVVWEDTVANVSVFARRVGATGVSGGSFAVADSATQTNWRPDVAYNLNHNEYLVVYTRGTGTAADIYGRRVYNAGSGGLLPEEAIDTSANGQEYPAVAAYRLNNSTPYLVVYTDLWNDTAGDVRGYMCNVSGQAWTLLNIATVPGRQEMAPDIASSELLGYTVVWQQVVSGDFDVHGRRVSGTGTLSPAFEVSVGDRPLPPGHDEAIPAVVGGSPLALAVWHERAGTADWDVFGRFLGYRTFLPISLRNNP